MGLRAGVFSLFVLCFDGKDRGPIGQSVWERSLENPYQKRFSFFLFGLPDRM